MHEESRTISKEPRRDSLPKILIVDDSLFMRKKLRSILTKAGYADFAEAENGAVAIEKYRILKPDLVLLDIVMDPSGIEALEGIRKIDSSAKIIAVSAVTAGDEFVAGLKQLGLQSFVLKPFKDEEILQEVQKLKMQRSIPKS